MESACKRMYLLRSGVARKAGPIVTAPFAHTFSHYRLQVTPLRFDGARALASGIADDPDSCWLHQREWRDAALPAPVRRLLESLEEDR